MVTWPTRVAASSANFYDHFPGASLNARWTALTSGTGSVSVTDSYVSMASGGSGGAAGIYYTTKLDKAKSQLWLFAVSGQHTSGASIVANVVNKATAPVADTDANYDTITRFGWYLLGGGSSDALYLRYFDSSHTEFRWDGAWTNGGSFAVQPVSSNSYYILGFEIDAPNARFRLMSFGKNDAGGGFIDQGLRLWALSDWVLFSAIEASADLWLVIGAPFTDWAASKEWRCEWVRYAEQGSAGLIEGWAASKDAIADGHVVKHHWSYDGKIFVPQDRTTTALAPTGAGFESFEIQAPSIAYDGVNTDYMFYTGFNSDFSNTGIGVAKATHAVPQNGSWTRGGSNPIIVPSGSEDRIRYSVAFRDNLETDANKRWKLIYAARFTADGNKRIQYATAPDPPDSSSWTKQGTLIGPGSAGDFDELGTGDGAAVVYVDGVWHLFYEGMDAGGLTRVLHASGSSLTSLSKEVDVAYIAHQANGTTTLTANLTTSRTVTVASSTGFVQDGLVAIDQNTNNDEYAVSRVRKVVSSTSIELYHQMTGFTTTLPARIRQLDRAPQYTPRAVIKVGAEWWFFTVQWGIYSDDASVGALLETMVLYTHSGSGPASATPAIDHAAAPMMPLTEFTGRRSVENASILMLPLQETPRYAYPTADVTDGSWLNEAGSATNLFASVDEADVPTDSDYIQSATGPSSDMVELSLGSVPDPRSSANHVLRYRVRLDAAGQSVDITTELRQGTAALSTPASFATTISSATEATTAQVLSAAQADAITDYSSLRLRITATAQAATAPTLVGAGTAAYTATSAATIAPGLPTGWAADDIHVIVAARSDNTAMTSLTGWTLLSAGNNTTGQRVEVWWRRAVAGDTAPTITFGSGTIVRGARMYGVRGCPPSGDPFSVALSRSDNAASATVTFATITPPDANTLLLALYAYEDDPSAASQITNWSTFTVSTSSLGADMALGHASRTWTSANSATGGLTSTVSGGTFTNSPNVGVILSFKPITSRARLTWAQFEVPGGQDIPEIWRAPSRPAITQLLAQ